MSRPCRSSRNITSGSRTCTSRIASANNGPNVPLGQGDTPIKEALQLMRDNKWRFQATIEFEYPIPEGSDLNTELARCMQYLQGVPARVDYFLDGQVDALALRIIR